MNAMHEERGSGGVPGGGGAHSPQADRAGRRRREALVQPTVRSHSDTPMLLAGHAFAGVVYSTAGTSPRVVGLVCIAALAADHVPMPVGMLHGGPMLGDVTEQHLAGTEWVIVPLDRTTNSQREHGPAAWISTAKRPRLESRRLTLLPQSLEHPVVIIDAPADAASDVGSSGTP